MYTFCIIMISIASILLILAVLVQSPKSGMAANFGAANQTMGVRQTTDFLEKFTWAMVAAIVFFALLSVTAMPSKEVAEATTQSGVEQALADINAESEETTEELTVEASTEEAAATETTVEVAESTEATPDVKVEVAETETKVVEEEL